MGRLNIAQCHRNLGDWERAVAPPSLVPSSGLSPESSRASPAIDEPAVDETWCFCTLVGLGVATATAFALRDDELPGGYATFRIE